jgi:hypothetical protein
LNWSEQLIAHRLRSWNEADGHDKAAKAALEEADRLGTQHRGPAAAEFRNDEGARLREKARRHGIESKICMRRGELLNQGYLPNGPDERSDHDWMAKVQSIFGKANSAGITRSPGERLRTWNDTDWQ